MTRKLLAVALLTSLATASIATPSFSQERDHTPPPIGLMVASKLSAAETYIGVKPEQLSAWNAYTSALIALLEAGGPGHDGPGPRPFGEEHKPGDSDGKPAPLFSEHLADRAIDAADKATALKAAIATLRNTLDADQLRRLSQAERGFAPDGQPPFRGSRERPEHRD